MSAEFYSGPGWQQSSSPYVTRKIHKEDDDATALLWPVGTPHDDLADGLHPVLAFGRKANRPICEPVVVVTYDAETEIAVCNIAAGQMVYAYVLNVDGYGDTDTPNSWVNTVYPGDPVYIDDTADVGGLYPGCTLSFSALNDAGANNPLAGFVFWAQDEYAESDIGGVNSEQQIPQPAADDTTEVLTLAILIANTAQTGV